MVRMIVPDARTEFDGACHCGAVRFRAALTGGLEAASRCNCSMCARRGAVVVTVKRGDLAILAGEDQIATYRFNTCVAEHHFCIRCGIYTHHRRRSDPGEYGVNVACLEGLSPFDFAELTVNDGRNHAKDQANGKTRIAGVLRYTPAED